LREPYSLAAPTDCTLVGGLGLAGVQSLAPISTRRLSHGGLAFGFPSPSWVGLADRGISAWRLENSIWPIRRTCWLGRSSALWPLFLWGVLVVYMFSEQGRETCLQHRHKWRMAAISLIDWARRMALPASLETDRLVMFYDGRVTEPAADARDGCAPGQLDKVLVGVSMRASAGYVDRPWASLDPKPVHRVIDAELILEPKDWTRPAPSPPTRVQSVGAASE